MNTIHGYQSDLQLFIKFLLSKNIHDFNNIRPNVITSFIISEKQRGQSVNSINRAIVSIRMFYKFLILEGNLQKNPLVSLDSPKLWKKLPYVLPLHKIEDLLSSADVKTKLGVRNKDILELLYATGARVSEVATISLNGINLEYGYI